MNKKYSVILSQWDIDQMLFEDYLKLLKESKETVKKLLVKAKRDPKEYNIKVDLGIDWGYYQGDECGKIIIFAEKKK